MKQLFFILSMAFLGLSLSSCEDPAFKQAQLTSQVLHVELDSTYEYVLKANRPANLSDPVNLLCQCKEKTVFESIPTDYEHDGGARYATAIIDRPTIKFICDGKTTEKYIAYRVYLPVVDTTGGMYMWERTMLVPEGLDVTKLGRIIEIDGKEFHIIPGKATDEFQLNGGERRVLIKYHSRV